MLVVIRRSLSDAGVSSAKHLFYSRKQGTLSTVWISVLKLYDVTQTRERALFYSSLSLYTYKCCCCIMHAAQA
jgi:hypothetical protein